MAKTVSKNIEKMYPLSPLQEGLFFLKLRDESSTQYVVQNIIEVEGNLTKETIADAFRLLSLRYDVIRTAFHHSASGKPIQIVLANKLMECNCINLSNETEADIEKIAQDDVKRGFDFKKDTLMRATILQVSNTRFVILWTFHHIIMDGWSLGIVKSKFIEYLNRLMDGDMFDSIKQDIAKEREFQPEYSNYIKWIQQTSLTQAKNYWQEYLQDYEEITDVKPFGGEPSLEGNQRTIKKQTGLELARKIQRLKEQNHITNTVVFEACWGILLQRLSNTKDAVFGKVVSGRNVKLSGMESIVGMFINTIPTRIDCRSNPAIYELLETIHKDYLDSSNYDFVPLSVSQSVSRQGSQLIQSIYTFENYYMQEEKEKSKIKMSITGSREQTSYNLSLMIYENTDFYVNLMYNPALYSETFMEQLLDKYMNLLEQIVSKPEMKVEDLNLLSQHEEKLILQDFNKPIKMVTSDDTILAMFDKVVSKYSAKDAIVFMDKRVTYQELDTMSSQIANYLVNEGVRKEDFVGLICNRGVEMIASMLGVMKAGAAYVPIDPTFPDERIQFIVKDCKPACILTSLQDLNYPAKNIAEILNNEKSEFTGDINIQNSNLAYLIYTSGTTGTPKGVAVEHSGVVNLSRFFQSAYNVTSEDNILQFANYVFDASVWEITMALLIGGTLVIPDNEIIKDVGKLEEYCIRTNVTVATMPPQYYIQTTRLKLRLLITAGSEANQTILQRALKSGRYVNAYGPTETTVCATSFEADKNCNGIIPIGKPILNTQVLIMKENQLCGIGIPGELCVSGVGLARGYINRSELTDEKFIDNPFGEGKLYRTGDLARWLPNGNIDFLGRIDNQVKVRGFRIELGEIENVIRRNKEVNDAAVTVSELNNGEKVIVAYITSEADMDLEKLKDELKKVLPSYMLPSFITRLDAIPLTRSGKLDKAMLPSIQEARTKEYIEPRNKLESDICQCIQDVIQVEKLGVYDNIFELGATSLTVTKIILYAAKKGFHLTIQNLFDYPDVDSLCHYLESKKHSDYFIEKTKEYERLNYLLENNTVSKEYEKKENQIHSVLVTGAAGFLGIHLVNELIKQNCSEIYCLVRGANQEKCTEKFLANYSYFFGEAPSVLEKVTIICGDILDKNLSEILPSKVDCVVHTAADIRHFGDKKRLYSTNVTGTENMLDYAQKTGAQFAYVSTTSVCGNVFTDNEVNEFSETSYYVGQFFISPYMKTKFEAERRVLEAIENGYDCYIIRVGNLTNRIIDGKSMMNLESNRFFALIQGYVELGCYSDGVENSLAEFSPIDLTAEGITVLLKAHKKGESVYHLFNNHYVRMKAIIDKLKESGCHLEKVDEKTLDSKINDTLLDDAKHNIYDKIKRTDVYDLEKSFKHLTLKTEFTDWILKENGFVWQEIDDYYIGKIVLDQHKQEC